MEAVLLHRTLDQSMSPNNNHQFRSRKNNIHGFVSRSSSENFAPVHPDLVSNIHGGLGLGGSHYFGYQLPNLSSSFSSHSSVPVFNNNQPPLLPLPVTKPYSSLPGRTNNNMNKMNKSVPFSPIPNNKKNNNRIREQDHQLKQQKKSRSQSTSPKKQNSPKLDSKNLVVISSTKRLGPEPSDLPKGVSRVLKPLPSSAITTTNLTAIAMEGLEEEEFSGSIFSLAPPPSSLPLPKFSLRPKLVPCNVEAASGIDDGATDNLRRLLRLR